MSVLNCNAKNIVTYFAKVRAEKPAKLRCYSTTGKHAVTSLNKKQMLLSSR
jgi:hypothetical protein